MDDLSRVVVLNMNNGKGGICHAAHRANGKGSGNRRHTFLNGKSRSHHRGDDLGGQSGKDTRLNTASKTVCQHDDCGVFVFLYDVYVVTAKLLADMIDAFVSDICTQIIHRR